MIRALEFSQWLEVLGQLFQAMLKLLQAIQVMGHLVCVFNEMLWLVVILACNITRLFLTV